MFAQNVRNSSGKNLNRVRNLGLGKVSRSRDANGREGAFLRFGPFVRGIFGPSESNAALATKVNNGLENLIVSDTRSRGDGWGESNMEVGCSGITGNRHKRRERLKESI